MRAKSHWIYVWDSVVRLFHWVLVAAFAVAYLTGDDVLAIHVWAGYAIGILVVVRVLWGFVGPRHARFRDFIYGPLRTSRYLVDLLTFRAKRYLGHSPAGGAMIILLLISLSATVATGLVVYAVEKNSGPLTTFITSPAASSVNIPQPRGDEDKLNRRADRRKSALGETVGELHEFLANLTLVLVLLHVAAVIFASVVHRENLVRTMITGWKRTEPETGSAVGSESYRSTAFGPLSKDL